MGQPVKFVELAQLMVQLSGLQVNRDIDIVFTGMRPGERLNEILFLSQEPTIEIGIAGIMAAKPNQPPMDVIRTWMEVLDTAITMIRPRLNLCWLTRFRSSVVNTGRSAPPRKPKHHPCYCNSARGKQR